MTFTPNEELIGKIADLYRSEYANSNFLEDLCLHRIYGRAIVTPSSILLGRPIHHEATFAQISDIRHQFDKVDTWFVWLAVGAGPLDFIAQAPYPLPYFAWSRRGIIRLHNALYLQRKTSALLRRWGRRSDEQRREASYADPRCAYPNPANHG